MLYHQKKKDVWEGNYCADKSTTNIFISEILCTGHKKPDELNLQVICRSTASKEVENDYV